MKIVKALSLAAIVFAFAACKKENPTPANTSPKYSFKNQELQGKIGNQLWQVKSSMIRISAFGSPTANFSLYSETITDICSSFELPNSDRIIFFMDELKLGLTELSLEGQTITLFDAETSNNQIATEGAIEILTIDSINNRVTGRMDIKADGGNFANGNFTVEYCR